MQPVQTLFYHYNKNAHAQYQVAPVEMVAGHAIRVMMDPGSELVPALCGIVELDAKYIGGKPRYQKQHKF